MGSGKIYTIGVCKEHPQFLATSVMYADWAPEDLSTIHAVRASVASTLSNCRIYLYGTPVCANLFRRHIDNTYLDSIL